MRILLVEDEVQMADMLIAALARQAIVVDHVDSLALATEAAHTPVHDAVLLDRKLPDGDGLSLLPLVRKLQPGVPVIVLSALGELKSRVEGLDEGADDYLPKPFSIDELLARLRAVLRRPTAMVADTAIVGRLVFDFVDRKASVDGVALVLTRREILVLERLAKRSGRTVIRGALEEAVYGYGDEIQSNTLDSHISRLRRKLAIAEAAVEIHAIRGIGYLLRGEA